MAKRQIVIGADVLYDGAKKIKDVKIIVENRHINKCDGSLVYAIN